MPLCEKHTCFYTKFCHECNQENIKLVKEYHRKAKKKDNVFGRTYKVSDKSKLRDKLKNKLQAEWRKVIYPFYKKRGLAERCWIQGTRIINQKGSSRFWTGQVSHFYGKGDIWQLWIDPVNSGICSYDTNINKQSIVARMEPMMVRVWGQERVDELKRKSEIYSFRIKTGQDPRFPPIDWLYASIEECKRMKLE